jgi:CBS domain containing-hemolysin-like protein
MLTEVSFVHKSKELPVVLDEMRRKKIHMAVVTDDYGGTLGILTMEDILEQLVGEIWDETDIRG